VEPRPVALPKRCIAHTPRAIQPIYEAANSQQILQRLYSTWLTWSTRMFRPFSSLNAWCWAAIHQLIRSSTRTLAMCRKAHVVCATCYEWIEVKHECCKSREELSICTTVEAYHTPRIERMVCFSCIRSRMSSIQRAVESPVPTSISKVQDWFDNATNHTNGAKEESSSIIEAIFDARLQSNSLTTSSGAKRRAVRSWSPPQASAEVIESLRRSAEEFNKRDNGSPRTSCSG
jgi:hypothetical protein